MPHAGYSSTRCRGVCALRVPTVCAIIDAATFRRRCVLLLAAIASSRAPQLILEGIHVHAGREQPLGPNYAELYRMLLTPALWACKGNVPALTTLVCVRTAAASLLC
jgi:hypothetical protein